MGHPYSADYNALIYAPRGYKRGFKRIAKGVGSFYFSFTDLLAEDTVTFRTPSLNSSDS